MSYVSVGCREKLRLGIGGGVPINTSPASLYMTAGELDRQGESGVGVVRSFNLSIMGLKIPGEGGTDSGEVTVGVDCPDPLE